MDYQALLDWMDLTEKLKCNTRHSWTSSGRHESVAEHSFGLGMLAWLVKDEFPECDANKVMEMCLIHDIGEAITGDIPSFEKKLSDEEREKNEIQKLSELLPNKKRQEFLEHMEELWKNETVEAKLVHALDKMEAVIQHNQASIDTWLPLEYELQLTYGQEEASFHPFLRHLRKIVEKDSEIKMDEAVDEALEAQISGEIECSDYKVRKGLEVMDKERVAELLHSTDWARERSVEMIEQSMEQSISYGVFDKNDYQIGYARIISDLTTTFYLMDVVIDEGYRGRGLGKLLMDSIMEDVGHLYGILHTENAAGLYEKYGFREVKDCEDKTMEKPRL